MAGPRYVPALVRLPRGSSAPIVVLVAAGVVRLRAWEFWTDLIPVFVGVCVLFSAMYAGVLRIAKAAPLPDGVRVVSDATVRRVTLRAAAGVEVVLGVLIALGGAAAMWGFSLALTLATLAFIGAAADRWWCRVAQRTGEGLFYRLGLRSFFWPEVLRTPPAVPPPPNFER